MFVSSPLKKMATKDITVNGEIFRCPIDWTLTEARDEIRDRYVLEGGGIDHNNVPVRGSDLIKTFSGTLAFVGGRSKQQPSPPQAQERRVNTPPTLITQQVFVLGLGGGCSANMNLHYHDLRGTCFAVTKKHVLTARHILCEDDFVTPLFDATSGKALNGRAFVISRSGTKVASFVSFLSPMEVKVVHSNVEHDWAMLELVDPALEFPAYFQLCRQSELPQLTAETVDLKALVAPIGQFIRSAVRDLEIWSDDYQRVLQYDKNHTQIIVDHGLYRGSCGSPYVNHRGKVVALHLESDNEGQNASLVVKPARKCNALTMLELTNSVDEVIDHVTDLSAVYASTRIGVVLANVPDLIELIDEQNQIL